MNETENHEIPNCKEFLAHMGPIETLLGSVSYSDIDNVDGKMQHLRASARVFKKMKFDQSNNAAAIEKKEKKEEVKPEEIKPENKKPVNPFWTSEEKKMFFEALNEYGKDFESIHMFISTRLKKKGLADDQIKTKHQIRHFYYKTFHMLCGCLKFSDKIPKNVQELYTLINYGEMRRKIGSVNKKNWSKLNELIANGFIPLRIKGKTIRIKTPMCRALRRLNQLDEKYDDLKLPTRVLVELKPRDMVSFLKVQSMAQNPRIKVALSLQKRLSSLINCINTRWKSTDAVVYDEALISTNPTTKDCVPDQKIVNENLLLLTPLLRLTPPKDTRVELPLIDISEYFTGQSISLTAFETRKGAKKEVKKEEHEVGTKAEKSPSKENGDAATACDYLEPVAKGVDEAVTTILSVKVQDTQSSKCDSKNNLLIKNPKSMSLEEKLVKIEQIREGWTVESCGCLTVGELYLMFGLDSKLFLEYSWDSSGIKSHKEDVGVQQENNLSSPLRKLLSLAKLQPEAAVVKCSCGHVCGSKSNTQFKKPLTAKVVKKTQVTQESTSTILFDAKTQVTDAINSTETKADENSDDQSFYDSNSSMVQLFHQRDNLQKMNPRMRLRGRSRYKQLVVERKLVPKKSESKHQIVSMNIVSQENNSSEDLSTFRESRNLLNKPGVSSLGSDDNSNKLVNDSCVSEKNFSGLLGDNRSNSAMSTGISKILNENENGWIDSDVADYSLSSLLGHLDGPSKTNQSLVSISNDDTQLSQDVDSQLRRLLIETSVDYTAKFADLAAQVVDNKK